MNIHRMPKVLLVLFGMYVLLLSGCAKFIRPDIGAIARPDARINLVDSGVKDAAWDNNELELTYSYSESGDVFNFSGTLVFDRSLTDSFPVAKRFFLKMSFLDDKGSVLKTIDITPLISSFSQVPDQVTIKSSTVKPAGTRSIAFNYFGVFRGDSDTMGGDEWEIFYFPFD